MYFCGFRVKFPGSTCVPLSSSIFGLTLICGHYYCMRCCPLLVIDYLSLSRSSTPPSPPPSPPFLDTAGLLDRLHGDDPVCACGSLHSGGLHPDDRVGQRQTPQLLKGVQRLSDAALLHTPIHPVEPVANTAHKPGPSEVPPPSVCPSESMCRGFDVWMDELTVEVHRKSNMQKSLNLMLFVNI